jgi:hypothetical protein
VCKGNNFTNKFMCLSGSNCDDETLDFNRQSPCGILIGTDFGGGTSSHPQAPKPLLSQLCADDLAGAYQRALTVTL